MHRIVIFEFQYQIKDRLKYLYFLYYLYLIMVLQNNKYNRFINSKYSKNINIKITLITYNFKL